MPTKRIKLKKTLSKVPVPVKTAKYKFDRVLRMKLKYHFVQFRFLSHLLALLWFCILHS